MEGLVVGETPSARVMLDAMGVKLEARAVMVARDQVAVEKSSMIVGRVVGEL